uniref:(3S,6E)-nerolidol synthase 1-like n=1 Tax=Erigeron canadensis TaxID=72917 RepID=UPI001CB88F4C|nr:(3S,6E)-nerolidol synthase 1-like [Erigeron canadensis]
MAILSILSSYQSRLPTILVISAHKDIQYQPINTKYTQVSTTSDLRNSTRKITSTTSDQLIKHDSSNKPYESFFCNHINYINIAEEKQDAKHERLVKQVRRLMAKLVNDDDTFEDLILVDALQRLAIDYHFEDIINIILIKRYRQFNNTEIFVHHNLYEVSLTFRMLRQNGFHVSADPFMKFKGNDGNFEDKWNKDIVGLMALHEASHLRIKGEMILDEAERYSYRLLNDLMNYVDADQAEMIRNTLENPYHKTMPLFDIKKCIKYFDGTILQELAELNFSMMQSIRQKELDQISRWWKDLGLGQELTRARDQPLKWYLWSMAALTDPTLSQQRILLTKTISLIYIMDDIFDVYGTIEELTIFTEAINRWDIKANEQLPYYMKSTFKAVFDITNEIANKVHEQHGFNPISFLQNSWATLCNAFLVEAKWFASGHILNAKEYLENGIVTSGVEVVLVHCFFLLGDGKTREQAGLINDNRDIISSVATILRLWDDLGSAQDESQDGNDGSYIMYIQNEHEGCSVDVAREHVMNLISDTWKRLNKECLSSNPFSATFITAANNIARMVPLMYSYGDNGSLPLLDDNIKFML